MNARRPRLHTKGAFAIVALAALTLSACGGDDDDAASTPATTVAAATDAAAANAADLPAGSIGITLVDVTANKMLLTPSATSAPAGTVTFVATNAGNVEHEFVVLKTDIPAADLVIDPATDRTSEEAEGVENVGEIGSIKKGETKTLELDLEPGHYALICNLKGHLRMGMWSDFEVT
jgi:uncharacterized cupredoxin-like copper-binding protein